MIYRKEYFPQFRESDHTGLVGAGGYFEYFQDAVTAYMHTLGKGNDTLPEDYGICWVFTKYKLHIEKRTGYDSPLELASWVENPRPSVRFHQAFTVSRGQELLAKGRMESCLCDLNAGKIRTPQDIDYPTDTDEGTALELPPFQRFPKTAEGMELCYTHTVRYTDLDKSRHMNNQKYIPLFLNAFDLDFQIGKQITDFEIHYLRQCFEKERISIWRAKRAHDFLLTGVKEDGTLAVQASITFREEACSHA